MRNVFQINDHSLTFSTFAIRQYCQSMAVGGQPEAVLISLLQGEFVVLPPIILAGLQSTAMHENRAYTGAESLPYEIYEAAADSNRVAELLNAFVGSVVNKPTDEAGAYLEEYFEKMAAELEKPDVKKKPLIRPSLTSKNSKTGPTKRG
jgi:hypothetical protein